MSTIASFGRLAVIIIAAVGAGSVRAEDWTTGYASQGRTSYLPGVMVAPPFALAWEYASPKPLKGGALVAVQRAYVSDEAFHVWSLSLADGTVAWKHD
ncbi:MAG: hypothetical protein AAB368_03835, partial [bacterium]